MEQSKMSRRLTEAADLLAMVEEMLSRASLQDFSATAISGMRVTLRTAREALQDGRTESADVQEISQTNGIEASTVAAPAKSASPSAIMQQASEIIKRRELRASIEKFVDR